MKPELCQVCKQLYLKDYETRVYVQNTCKQVTADYRLLKKYQFVAIFLQ